MIILAVKIRSKPNQIENTARLLGSFPAKANQEPGCLQYELFRGAKDPQLFYFFEKWEDQAALDKHNTQGYLKEFHSRFEELLDCPNEVLFLS